VLALAKQEMGDKSDVYLLIDTHVRTMYSTKGVEKI